MASGRNRVWLHLLPEWKSTRGAVKLRQQKFRVLEEISPHNYRLELPPGSTIHNVFHVDVLRAAGADPFPSQKLHDTRPGPLLVDGVEEYELEAILGERHRARSL
ncbi:hypothetical protein V1512DRAFT_159835 [Lipomyces arxii]|uniref:uncharacterized protein n=1 Tax=Lipomyces arxii TaxID=56418 RepID=UPI0034CF6522